MAGRTSDAALGRKHYGDEVDHIVDIADDWKRMQDTWTTGDFERWGDSRMDELSERMDAKEAELREKVADAIGSVRACWDHARQERDEAVRELAELRASLTALVGE